MVVFCVLCILGTTDALGSSQGAIHVSPFGSRLPIGNLCMYFRASLEWGLLVSLYKTGTLIPTSPLYHTLAKCVVPKSLLGAALENFEINKFHRNTFLVS